MVSHKKYSDEQYIKFLSIPFTHNFGMSEEEIADWFMSQPGAQPVINSYGVNKSNLLSTYIPKLKEMLGGYGFFLVYTVTEGGGAGNWINHYLNDTSSGGLNTLIDDCNYLLEVDSNYPNYPVAMTAPEVAGRPPQSDIDRAQEVYRSVGKGTIGSVFMPSTMAGNSWVFAEQWSLANQGPYAPAVYYGNPYDHMIDKMLSSGVDPFSGEVSSSTPRQGTSSSSQSPSTSSSSSTSTQQTKKKQQSGFYYVQNNTFWNMHGGGNVSRTNSTGSSSSSGSSGNSNSSSGSNNSSSSINNSSNFSSDEDKKLWEETAGENPAGGDGLTDHTKHARAFIMKKFGVTEAHGIRADDDGTGHGHNSGMAVDFMVGYGWDRDPVKGQEIADYFVSNFDELGVYYLIWEQKFYMNTPNIYGPANTWNPMPDRGSPTQNHMDHIHVSFAR